MKISSKSELKNLMRKTRYAASILKNIFRECAKKTCPCCGYEGCFDAIGNPPRYGAICSNCGSYERHRLFSLSDIKNNYFQGKKVLHFAPEAVLEKLIQGNASDYVTADIEEGRASKVLNIENIDYADNSWDVIVCSHVLEHVDDVKALAEMYRVLRKNGVLLIMVPIIEGWKHTYENANIRTDSDREKHFGQNDHVRYYVSEIRERISSHGFSVEEETAFGEDVVVYWLLRGEKIFICTK